MDPNRKAWQQFVYGKPSTHRYAREKYQRIETAWKSRCQSKVTEGGPIENEGCISAETINSRGDTSCQNNERSVNVDLNKRWRKIWEWC